MRFLKHFCLLVIALSSTSLLARSMFYEGDQVRVMRDNAYDRAKELEQNLRAIARDNQGFPIAQQAADIAKKIANARFDLKEAELPQSYVPARPVSSMSENERAFHKYNSALHAVSSEAHTIVNAFDNSSKERFRKRLLEEAAELRLTESERALLNSKLNGRFQTLTSQKPNSREDIDNYLRLRDDAENHLLQLQEEADEREAARNSQPRIWRPGPFTPTRSLNPAHSGKK